MNKVSERAEVEDYAVIRWRDPMQLKYYANYIGVNIVDMKDAIQQIGKERFKRCFFDIEGLLDEA